MDADAPYNLNPTADVVLHSSDNVFFYVLGSLLRFVSPFFSDMFLMNRGPAIEQNEKRDGLPVVNLEEDSETLRCLLDFFYPSIDEPQLPDVPLLRKVGKMAKKYLIDVVEGKLRDRLMNSKVIIDEPLRIYAVAIELGWESVAREAASRTLNCSLESLPPVEELHNITGSDFYRFLEYRLRCNVSARKKTEILMDLPDVGAATTNLDSHSCSVDPPVEPFGSSPTANLVLRSSDSVDFFVIEGLIRQVSLHFDSMFPLDNPQVKEGRPVINVADDSKSLRQLLNIIYPFVDDLDIQDFELYLSAVKAVRRYRMVTIENRLRRRALVSHLITSKPLRMYILATALQWEDVAKAAALNTLSQPLQGIPYLKELNCITGAGLYRLVSFRFRCGAAACKHLREDKKFTKYGPGLWQSYWYDYNHGHDYDYDEKKEVLEKFKTCPRASTVDEICTVELSGASSFSVDVSTVRKIISCQLRTKQVIEEAISEVFSTT